MIKRIHAVLMAGIMMTFAGYAQAGDYAVGVKVGTLGPSLEVTTNVIPMFLNARIQGNKYDLNRSFPGTSLDFDATLKLSSLALIGDVYPFAGKFRLSAGAYLNNNSLSLEAVPTAAGFVVNGQTIVIPAGQVGSITTDVTFNKLSPYLGFGWGDPVSSGLPFGLSLEFGVLFQGAPKVAMRATGIAATATATDISAEEKALEDELSAFTAWPVASIGVNFSF